MILTCTPWPLVPMLMATQPPASYHYRQPRTARTITTLGSTRTLGRISLTFGPDETQPFRPEATDLAPRDFSISRMQMRARKLRGDWRPAVGDEFALNAPGHAGADQTVRWRVKSTGT